MSLRAFFILASGVCLSSCSHIPLQEYAIARTALKSAKRVEAGRYDPTTYHRAEESYRRGEAYYRKEDYSEAEENFLAARDAAEKAENTARLQRFRTGEDTP